MYGQTYHIDGHFCTGLFINSAWKRECWLDSVKYFDSRQIEDIAANDGIGKTISPRLADIRLQIADEHELRQPDADHGEGLHITMRWRDGAARRFISGGEFSARLQL